MKLMTTWVDHDLEGVIHLHYSQVSKYHVFDEQTFSLPPFPDSPDSLDSVVSSQISTFYCSSTSWTCCGLDLDLVTEILLSTETFASGQEKYIVHLSVLPVIVWYYLSVVSEMEMEISPLRERTTAVLHFDCFLFLVRGNDF
jgi:hypothetical protein